MVPCPEGMLSVPQFPYESVEWRTGSAELRVVVDHKVVQVVEYAFCTCAVFADASSLITCSSDYTVQLWKVVRGPNPNSSSSALQVSLSHVMRVHTDEVGRRMAVLRFGTSIKVSMFVRYGMGEKVENLRRWTWWLSMKAQ
jgi:hypothetical protein